MGKLLHVLANDDAFLSVFISTEEVLLFPLQDLAEEILAMSLLEFEVFHQ